MKIICHWPHRQNTDRCRQMRIERSKPVLSTHAALRRHICMKALFMSMHACICAPTGSNSQRRAQYP